MIRLAVYGSLREGMGNHGFLQGSTKLSTEVIHGWDMYSFGAFPYVVAGDGNITVEVYDVPLSDISPIDSMEFGAGYFLASVETTVGDADLYVMSGFSSNWQQVPVPSGNWVEYYNAIKAERSAHHENATE